MAKVLWIGDAGCHTGFARVTHAIGERLVRDFGHEVHVIALNYRGDPWPPQGEPTPLRLYVPTMFGQNDIYGQRRYIELLGKIEPDVVVMLNDPNIILDLLLRNKYDEPKVLLRYRPILAYAPIDGHNHPPSWAPALHAVSKLIVMSEHGQREMTAVRPNEEEPVVPPVVYHGVDVDRFYPVSQHRPVTLSNGRVIRSKTEARQAFGWDADDFVVLRVDKNSGRKDYPATWKALVPFLRRHKNARAHLHCQGDGLEHGLDVKSMLTRDPETHGRFTMPSNLDTWVGWPEEDLVGLYNAADAFISTSRGEGFGLTIAEALACGVPVIAQNVSAIPEVVGPGGILIDPVREITTPSAKDQWLADVPAFTDALERLYTSRKLRRTLGAAARAHVEKSFSWDVAAGQFDGYLRELIEQGEKAAAALAASESISDGGSDG